MSVSSPCIDVCTVDTETGYCEGCLRTMDEIALWGRLNDAGKREILRRIARRRADVPAK